MNKTERSIQSEVWIEASNQGYTLYRNNVGMAWQGKRTAVDNAIISLNSRKIRVGRGVFIADARPVKFGLCEGSSDLIGLKPVIVTPAMVGTCLAVFTALEVKARGKPTKKQEDFLNFIQESGGIAAVVRSVEDIPSY